jgi:predicted transcriptional regulator/prefoldin subunit 5
MAGEEHADVSVRLPSDLEEWLDEHAEATGQSRDELVGEFLSAYRAMQDNGTGAEVLTAADVAEYAEVGDLDDLVDGDELEAALETQRSEFTELLEDVRKRVVQVKRETDAKAPADHDHEVLSAELDELSAAVEALEDDLASVESEMDAGFENFEDVLEYLTDATDDLEAKTGTLASVLVELRSTVERLQAREARRAETDALKLAANREGVESAKCEDCDTPVRIALLSDPECPHCASTFNDVEKRSGLFSSNRLVTGDAPALPEPAPSGLGDEDLVEELAETAEDGDE